MRSRSRVWATSFAVRGFSESSTPSSAPCSSRLARASRRRRLDDVELFEQSEVGLRERRLLRPLAYLVPVDLLTERAAELEHAREVRILLCQREQLLHEHVLEWGDLEPNRVHLELLGAVERVVVDLTAARGEDEVDQ